MEFNVVRRAIKKTKKIAGSGQPNDGVVIKSRKWMRKKANSYLEQTQRDLEIRVETNAKSKVAYPNISRAVEYAVNELQKEQKHTFQNILVIKNPYQYAPLSH